MLTIQNYKKLIGSKLDKKNYVVNNIVERTIIATASGVQVYYYIFELENDTMYKRQVWLKRELDSEISDVGYSMRGDNGQTRILLDEIKNKDRFIDRLRWIGIK